LGHAGLRLGCVTLVAAVLALAAISPLFAWDQPWADRPTVLACALIAGAGLGFLAIAKAVPSGKVMPLGVLIGLGIGLRLVMIGSTPIWEDDFYRYLWDGAAVSRGMDPYQVSPLQASDDAAPENWKTLASDEPGLRERINYPQFRSLYPIVAQGAFAAAWVLGGGLLGLRMVLLAAEFAGLCLLLLLLRRQGLPLQWSALYWLNPLAILCFANAVHVDAVLIPLIVAALLAMTFQRRLIGSALIGLAAGVKLWPILLWPLVVRASRPTGLIAFLSGGAIAGALFVLSIAPVVAAGLGSDAGLVAYAEHWTRNSAVHPLLFDGMTALVRALGLIQSMDPDRTVRVLLGLTGTGLALVLAARAEPGRLDPGSLLLLAFVILALSPAQYPWYGAAILPLAALAGAWRTAGAAAVVSAVYYLRFVLDEEGTLLRTLIWVEHLTLWAALATDLRRSYPTRALRIPGTACGT